MNLDKILAKVEKPARYTGGEWNVCYKDVNSNLLRVAFCFPDVYEVGMSHLGLRILYEAVNREKDVYLERVFAPWVDMEKEMRENNIPLYTLETKTPLNKFDILAFTLQYEMSFSNILNMLDLGGVAVKKCERGENDPLVIAGGPCASNPETLADFVDVFLIGDGEESLPMLTRMYKECKDKGLTKKDFLKQIAKEKGVYVPEFYNIIKDENGRIQNIEVLEEGVSPVVEKCIVTDLENAVYPENFIVPNMGIVHDRITLEIMRGCTRGCRFCQAGYIYRPVREKSKERILSMAKNMVKNTGYDEISLSSLSSSDHSEIAEITSGLNADLSERCVSVALPSLRLDNFSRDIIKNMPDVKKTGLTFAPEAGTQRLRDVINKNVTEQDLIETVRTAFELGWNRVKLYFMIGLPTETMEDIQGIVDMANLVADEYEKINGKRRGLTVTVSTSTFVPKSHTPFEWFGQDSMEDVKMKQDFLKESLKQRWFKYNWHDSRISMLESIFARGGREICEVLYKAHKKGCRFDSWANEFKYDAWLEAFSECGLDPFALARRTFEEDEIMPWDMISYRVSKDFLLKEKQRAESGETISDCRKGCKNCGLLEVCKSL